MAGTRQGISRARDVIARNPNSLESVWPSLQSCLRTVNCSDGNPERPNESEVPRNFVALNEFQIQIQAPKVNAYFEAETAGAWLITLTQVGRQIDKTL